MTDDTTDPNAELIAALKELFEGVPDSAPHEPTDSYCDCATHEEVIAIATTDLIETIDAFRERNGTCCFVEAYAQYTAKALIVRELITHMFMSEDDMAQLDRDFGLHLSKLTDAAEAVATELNKRTEARNA